VSGRCSVVVEDGADVKRSGLDEDASDRLITPAASLSRHLDHSPSHPDAPLRLSHLNDHIPTCIRGTKLLPQHLPAWPLELYVVQPDSLDVPTARTDAIPIIGTIL
jgi:hypothetical protein